MEENIVETEEQKISRRELADRLAKLAGAATLLSVVASSTPAAAAPSSSDRKILIERLTNTQYTIKKHVKINDGTADVRYVNYAEIDPENVHYGTDGLEKWLFIGNGTISKFKDIRSNNPNSQQCLTETIPSSNHPGIPTLNSTDVRNLSQIVSYMDSGSHWQMLYNNDSNGTGGIDDPYLNDVYHVMKHKINYEMDWAKARAIAGFLVSKGVDPNAPDDNPWFKDAVIYLTKSEPEYPYLVNYFGQYGLIGPDDHTLFSLTLDDFKRLIREEAGIGGPAQGTTWY